MRFGNKSHWLSYNSIDYFQQALEFDWLICFRWHRCACLCVTSLSPFFIPRTWLSAALVLYIIRHILDAFKNIVNFFVSETHLPTDDEVQLQVNGFMLIGKSRASGQEGGVGAYISSTVLFHRRLDLEEDIECIRLEILFPKTKDLLLELFIALLTRRNISDQITQANLSCVIREQRMHIHRWYTL